MSKTLYNNLAFIKFSNPHNFWDGFQKLINIFIPNYLEVSRKLPEANPLLRTNNNLNTISLQSTIIFKTLWKLIILLLFLSIVAIIVVWWEMENVSPSPYDLLERSHALIKHTLIIYHKKILGLFNVKTPIQVLAYGCMEGLFEVVYIAVTKSNMCLQHCC